MRRLNIFYIILILFVSFLSCTKNEFTPKYLIGFSQPTTGDDWRKYMVKEMERELLFFPDFNLIVKDAENSSEKQIEQIKDLVRNNIDLLIVSPNESQPLEEIIEEVYESGIPVIIIDRAIKYPHFNTFIGADNLEIGKIAGEYTVEILNGNGNILEIWGLKGSSPARQRHIGFESAINQAEGVNVVQSVNGRWQEDVAMAALLEQDPQLEDIDLIFAHNDVMGMAARQYLDEKGIEGEIKILGVDGLYGQGGGIQMVINGILDATFLYPTGGEEAINTAVSILKGEEYASEIKLQTSIIDHSNARMLKLQGDKLLNQQLDIERQNKSLFNLSESLETQRLFLYILAAFSLLLLLLSGIVMHQLSSKQKVNIVLEKRNDEILNQRNELERLSNEKEAAHKEKDEFFTNISHEFKTPITLILGPTADLLKKDKIKNKENRHQIELIQKNALRLNRLITQLMDFKRIENQKLKLKLEVVDLVGFIKDIMSVFYNLTKEKEIDFKLVTHRKKFDIPIDREIFDKVLFNLLYNAFKFTSSAGFIHVQLGENKEKNMAVIKVSDNGRGMSPEHTEHVFERYYQGVNYSSKGTGLGLSLSKKLIELHGGDIEVVSEKGIGTTFTFRLPVKSSIPEELKTEVKLAETDLQSKMYQEYAESNVLSKKENSVTEHTSGEAKKILLVEDNLDLLNFLQSILSDQYDILIAENGEIGIEICNEHIPDLIICDLMLPGIQGDEVVKYIKENVITSHIPVIMLTAKNDLNQKLKGYELGIIDYITKPFNPYILLLKIESILKNFELLQNYFSSNMVFDVNKQRLFAREKEFLQKFENYVMENYQRNDLQIDDICKHLIVSRVQLYRKLKAVTGISVNEYIQKLRIERAKELLSAGQLSLTEIAFQCGFNSSSYFSTTFKSLESCSPSDWKKKNR